MKLPEQKANQLVKRFNTRDPQIITEQLRITVISSSLPNRVKGISFEVDGQKIIGINSNHPDNNAVLGHELGHTILHEGMGFYFIREITHLSINKYEKEADLFAAELLIDEQPEPEETVKQFAAKKEVPVELVELWLKNKVPKNR